MSDELKTIAEQILAFDEIDVAAHGLLRRFADAYLAAEQARVEREKEHLQLLIDLQAAYQQLAYLWETTGSCPCGARRESPRTHPHVGGCPTAKAVEGKK